MSQHFLHYVWHMECFDKDQMIDSAFSTALHKMQYL